MRGRTDSGVGAKAAATGPTEPHLAQIAVRSAPAQLSRRRTDLVFSHRRRPISRLLNQHCFNTSHPTVRDPSSSLALRSHMAAQTPTESRAPLATCSCTHTALATLFCLRSSHNLSLSGSALSTYIDPNALSIHQPRLST